MWDELGILIEEKDVIVCYGTFIEIDGLLELESLAAV